MHMTNQQGRSVAILSVMLLILIARGVSAKFPPRQDPVGPSSQVESAPRTPVPTVTGYPTRTPTQTPTEFPPGTPTFTPTPTSHRHPDPPILIYPPDGGLLPQPVPPGEWYFEWSAPHGPCYTSIHIRGPGGRHIDAERQGWEDYEFQYTTDTYLPDDALGPWQWGVGIGCLGGNNFSEWRTFWVRSASEIIRIYLPWVKQGAR